MILPINYELYSIAVDTRNEQQPSVLHHEDPEADGAFILNILIVSLSSSQPISAAATVPSGIVTDVPAMERRYESSASAQGEDQPYEYTRSRISRSVFLSLSRKGHGGWKGLDCVGRT
jgi:hypothetical protein